MRIALGATRRQVLQQLLTESLLLGAGGGLLGIAASLLATHVLVTYLPAMPGALDVTPDGRVVAFTFAVTVATAIFFGAAPALRAIRLNAVRQAILRTRTSDALIVAQFALCVSLLVGAGLFLRTLQNLGGVDFGSNIALLPAVDCPLPAHSL